MFDMFQLFDDILKEEAAAQQQTDPKQDSTPGVSPQLDPEPTPQPVPVSDPKPLPAQEPAQGQDPTPTPTT